MRVLCIRLRCRAGMPITDDLYPEGKSWESHWKQHQCAVAGLVLAHLAVVQDNWDFLGTIQPPHIICLRRRDCKVVEQQPFLRWAAVGQHLRSAAPVILLLLAIGSWC